MTDNLFKTKLRIDELIRDMKGEGLALELALNAMTDDQVNRLIRKIKGN